MFDLINNFNESNHYCYQLNGKYRWPYSIDNAEIMLDSNYIKRNIYYELRSRIFFNELLIH